MISDFMAETLAGIAGDLPAEQLATWVEVLSTADGPSEELESALIEARPTHSAGMTARRLIDVWRLQGSVLSGPAIALALRVAGAVHEQADKKRSKLVISGPSRFEVPTRQTAAAAVDVVGGAQEKLLIVSFAAHGVAHMISELLGAAERGVAIDLVLESTTKDGGTLRGRRNSPGQVFASLGEVARFWCWPKDQRHIPKQSRPALHAKIIAADGATAMVSSANMTDRAFTRNIEIGVILRDPRVVGQLDAHFRRLMDPERGCLELVPPDIE